jgi:hypothetical protein
MPRVSDNLGEEAGQGTHTQTHTNWKVALLIESEVVGHAVYSVWSLQTFTWCQQEVSSSLVCAERKVSHADNMAYSSTDTPEASPYHPTSLATPYNPG